MFNLGDLFKKREGKKAAQVEPKRATQTQEIVRPVLPQETQYDRSQERLLRGMK